MEINTRKPFILHFYLNRFTFFCSKAKSFHDEMQDMLIRLSEIDGQLITAKPVGGMPETAKDQLERFMVSL